jgi:hypothetical protein
MHTQFKRGDFQFGFERVLGAANYGAADVGEVLATCARIEDGDCDSWLEQWTATAGAAWAAAGNAATHGRRASALSHYLRAARYYATALYLITHSSEPQRQLELWRRQRDCWDRAVELFPVPGESIAIPYENTTLPGYFFRAPDSRPGEPRALVVLNNGSSEATSQMWQHGGAGASVRGYHWMTFDGPGQQAMWFERGVPFRPDWEAVLTPVVDAMTARGDVDIGHMAVIGTGQGGYWIPRALAFEHRFAAGVADPGVLDVSRSWKKDLSERMRGPLERGARVAFDREMHLAELLSPGLSAKLESNGKPYGVESESRYELYKTVESYALGAETAQIATPLLITDPEQERSWPGQSKELSDRLSAISELMPLSAHDGAGRHGQPLAGGLRDARIFDWLEPHLRGDANELTDHGDH